MYSTVLTVELSNTADSNLTGVLFTKLTGVFNVKHKPQVKLLFKKEHIQNKGSYISRVRSVIRRKANQMTKQTPLLQFF
jgi:hypothetical protein